MQILEKAHCLLKEINREILLEEESMKSILQKYSSEILSALIDLKGYESDIVGKEYISKLSIYRQIINI